MWNGNSNLNVWQENENELKIHSTVFINQQKQDKEDGSMDTDRL